MAKKTRVIFIFLLILSAALAVFIGLQIIQYYKTGKDYTEETMRPSITCTGYIYSIKGMNYARNELTLTVYNQEYSDYEILNFSVVANRTYTAQTRIPQ